MQDQNFVIICLSGALALAAGTLYVLGVSPWAAPVALLGVAGIVWGSL